MMRQAASTVVKFMNAYPMGLAVVEYARKDRKSHMSSTRGANSRWVYSRRMFPFATTHNVVVFLVLNTKFFTASHSPHWATCRCL